MTVALHGNLQDFGIGEVFQLIGQQRKTGVLEVRGEHGEVELRFDSGGVVAAVPTAERPDAPLIEMIARCGVVPRDRLTELEREVAANEPLTPRILSASLIDPDSLREIEDLLTRETIFEVLRWESGSFRFVAQPIAHERPAEQLLGAEQVLMDGLRMVDEWRAFSAEVPADPVVFRRRGSLEEYRHSPAGRASTTPAEAERIYMLVDGRASVRRVVDLSRLGNFLAMRVLIQLARSGWIEPVRARRDLEPRASAPPHSSERRRRLALIGPFALLLALGGVAWWGRAVPSAEPLSLPVDVLAQARTRFETARWRSLLLAHRLATGRWAGGLEEVAQWAGDAAPALTRSERDAYYLGHRGEDRILLAPDR